jgi:hypothetical protein
MKSFEVVKKRSIPLELHAVHFYGRGKKNLSVEKAINQNEACFDRKVV